MINIKSMKTSTLYLLRDQTHVGRCVLSLDSHKTELFQLTEEEKIMFMEDVSRASEMIYTAFYPDKINYAIYGDVVSHLHYHLVPKYTGGVDWGEAFDNSPDHKTFLSNDEYRKIMEKILKKA
ncbi:HIT family protein [Salibacterium salarium]|uniref:HIT family protein n=2 Tax=Salibacterium salarium TaxID=284579 RepID=A0A3R9QS61_9BACI|nr:HIT family protein [Salibacterium salarium]